jgi:P27 family predicted phage terminase small subunit
MGERGPAPRPSAIKRAQGMRADRINQNEPAPELFGAPPPAPAHLDEVGRELWQRLAPPLVAAGVLTPWDVEVFALLCESVSIAHRAAELLRAGLVMKGRRDGVITSPAWRVYRDAAGLVRALAREFGLTPSARSSLRIDLTLHARGIRPGP